MTPASVALACTWRPRGELPRLLRLYPFMRELYQAVAISVPPDAVPADVGPLGELPDLLIAEPTGGTWGRHTVLTRALATPAPRIHYADLDRLLHWIETRPDELRRTVAAITNADCLILGRTEPAFATHPQAMQETERLINLVFATAHGRAMDLCGGSRGLSRTAARFVVDRTAPGGWGEAEWSVLLGRAGFRIDYLEVDGLDWETPDQFRPTVADPATRRRLADEYDRDPANWATRVRVAREIIAEGLAALARPIRADDAGRI